MYNITIVDIEHEYVIVIIQSACLFYTFMTKYFVTIYIVPGNEDMECDCIGFNKSKYVC